MIHITGDVHGGIDNLLGCISWLPEDTCKKDIFIVCGDFGFIWWDIYNTTKLFEENNQFFLDSQEKKLDQIENDFPATVVFVDGNHENHIKLAEYPLVKYNGGWAHQIRPHIYHLCRGEIFNFEGLKFFAFGGAASHDIQDGILDPESPLWEYTCKQLDMQRALYRSRRIDWWPQEFPTTEEMNNGMKNLSKCNFEIDYIISHDCPAFIKPSVHFDIPDDLNMYLGEIHYNCLGTLKRHYFGHYHMNKLCDIKSYCIYDRVERIN